MFFNSLYYWDNPYFEEKFHQVLSMNNLAYDFGSSVNSVIASEIFDDLQSVFYIKNQDCSDKKIKDNILPKSCIKQFDFYSKLKADLNPDVSNLPYIFLTQKHFCSISKDCELNAVDIILDDAYLSEGFVEKLIRLKKIEGMKISNWMSENKSQLSMLKILNAVILFVFVMLVAIVGFSIISMMFFTVINKKAHISILKAMGATYSTIRNIFLLVGISIALIGATSGVILGILMTYLINMNHEWIINNTIGEFNKLIVPDSNYLFYIAISVLVINTLSAVIPARFAAKQDVVDGLKTG